MSLKEAVANVLSDLQKENSADVEQAINYLEQGLPGLAANELEKCGGHDDHIHTLTRCMDGSACAVLSH